MSIIRRDNVISTLPPRIQWKPGSANPDGQNTDHTTHVRRLHGPAAPHRRPSPSASYFCDWFSSPLLRGVPDRSVDAAGAFALAVPLGGLLARGRLAVDSRAARRALVGIWGLAAWSMASMLWAQSAGECIRRPPTAGSCTPQSQRSQWRCRCRAGRWRRRPGPSLGRSSLSRPTSSSG